MAHPARMLLPVPLPTDATARDLDWPPKALGPFLADVAEADAWFTGDTAKLQRIYQGTVEQPRPGLRDRLWGRAVPQGQRDRRIHVPIAADIAQAGADLLFSEDAVWTIPEAHQESADAGAIAAETRLAELSELMDLGALLLEAAEIAGGLSGVYLRPTWDVDIAAHPLIHLVTPDRAVPVWRYGRLAEVTFWFDLYAEPTERGRVVWRHLEHHEPGRITHGLYVGSQEKLGQRIDLKRHPVTKGLPDEINLVAELGGFDDLLPVYVPNVRPNRKHRGLPVGRADTAGHESLMDALDETMTSWQRDIRLGKARIIVPDEFLDRNGRGQGAGFDTDREIYSPLDMDPSNMEKAGITPVEFKIRTDEHAATAAHLVDLILRGAGYSPRSLGIADGGTKTATEVTADTSLSERTTARKQRYWGRALSDLSVSVLVIDRAKFSSGVEPMRARVDFADLAAMDLRDRASALNLINLARAASTETRVKILQPELEGDELAAEVARIQAEEGTQVADPTGGFV